MFANLYVIDLKDLYGKKWEGCQIRFKTLPYRSIVNLKKKEEFEQEEYLINILVDNFVDGQGITLEGEKKEITKEDFENYFLDVNFVNKASKVMMDTSEGLSQNSEEQ